MIEYACPGYEARDQAFPLGIVAQDDTGIHVHALPIDADRTAAACRLPLSTLAGWEADTSSRIRDPVFGSDGEPLDPRHPDWLTRFAQAGMEAKFFFGPLKEVPGSGPVTLAAIVAAETKT